jgi:hypothetical protein
LDLSKVVAGLKKERDRLTQAIEALATSYSPWGRKTKPGRKGTAPKRKRRGGLTPEGRRKLSLAMKKRWAERRKKGKSSLA